MASLMCGSSVRPGRWFRDGSARQVGARGGGHRRSCRSASDEKRRCCGYGAAARRTGAVVAAACRPPVRSGSYGSCKARPLAGAPRNSQAVRLSALPICWVTVNVLGRWMATNGWTLPFAVCASAIGLLRSDLRLHREEADRMSLETPPLGLVALDIGQT